jgi:pSer/pThr/pTyr-binding forkhead associated (FHA) protein
MDKALYIIGRGTDCDVVILNETVSRRHAAIRRHGDGWMLVDLGSKNGTWVNGVAVDGPGAVAIEPGDELRFAAVTARFDPDAGGPFRAVGREMPLAA